MKIHVRSEEHSFTIRLPTGVVFSRGLLKLGLRVGRKYSADVPDIPPETVDALCDEIRRIKKRHKEWELVDVQSADGDGVRITL